MLPTVAIVVYSCLATASFDDFDPHHVNAAFRYVSTHPGTCRADPPLVLDGGVSLHACQSQAMLHFMPNWIKDNPDRVWIGARCELHRPQDVIMGPTTAPSTGDGNFSQR